jgi:hypothetical protein
MTPSQKEQGSRLSAKSDRAIIFAGMSAMAMACVTILWATHWLQFPLDRDELHFWPASLHFSGSFLPDLHTLRAYGEPCTPLAFILFGELHHLFGHGLIMGRYVNFGLSAGLLAIIACVNGHPDRRSTLSALGLLLFPYYLGVGTHLYTDPLAVFFGTIGVLLHLRRQFVWAALCWVVAISARQYLVAIPAGIAGYELARAIRQSRENWHRIRLEWACPSAAACSLGGWVIFFGGLGPASAVAHIPTTQLMYVIPAHALYFLACIGLYYCLPEAVLFWQKPLHVTERPEVTLAMALSVGLAAAFILFPPMKNVHFFNPRMGFLDIGAHQIMGDHARMELFYFLALWAVVRFIKPRNTFSGWLLITNALVLAKAQIAWDKYAMPLLAVLWLLQALAIEAQEKTTSIQGQLCAGR